MPAPDPNPCPASPSAACARCGAEAELVDAPATPTRPAARTCALCADFAASGGVSAVDAAMFAANRVYSRLERRLEALEHELTRPALAVRLYAGGGES